MELTPQQLRKFARIQRKKYHVSVQFLKYNMVNIEKFLWYALSPRLTIKRMAVRKRRGQRIVLDYYHLRRVLFDQMDRKLIKARKRNVQQWSRRMVCYLRNNNGVKEYVEETAYGQPDSECSRANAPKASVATEVASGLAPEEVSKQMKEQLELLRSGKRTVPLMEGVTAEVAADAKDETETSEEVSEKEKETASGSAEGTAPEVENAKSLEKESTIDNATGQIAADGGKVITSHAECHPCGKPALLKKTDSLQNKLETTPEKQIILGRSESFLDTLQNPRTKTQRTEVSTDESCAAEEFIHVPFATVTAITAPDLDADIVQEPVPKKLRMFAPLDIDPEVNKVPATIGTGGRNFLDMLMNKVGAKGINSELPTASIAPAATVPAAESRQIRENSLPSATKSQDSEQFTDSSEEFFGFDETERVPGMMLTPLVPHCIRSKGENNSAFVSESLNEYLRENSLETSSANDGDGDGVAARRHRQANLDGLVTPGCTLPHMDMPLVPESLQKLRTVAERRQYLQKFHKNHKLAIINNEATIYRELQRKTRLQKSKSVSQQLLQAPNAQMPFTRRGWQAASFVTTEFNKYYYQMLQVDGELVRLPGVRGNNEERYKRPYRSRVTAPQHCSDSCCDLLTWRDFKPIKTTASKKKLNKAPLPSVFKPCPLSHKPFQKPLDDETAALLLAGGSMAVVRMPTVELQVFPALGKPLHEVAKRYLEYILPHHDISREWAEFSVSTLQQPRSMKETEKVVATSCAPERRKSFTFAIPYLNDRSHILVRRVVDRSEKLDQSFEMAKESDTAMLEDLSFRANLDTCDEELMDCANVLSDMINSVAISCSENSFIKEDPDGLHAEEIQKTPKMALKDEKSMNGDMEQAKIPATGTQQAATKKQNRMMLELRRLNATIIDAAVKAEKETKPCSKEYCALGCVCTSLADDYPLRQHCGKSKCVIECTCKTSNQSRIMRVETDGRSITTEDAFMLRRKATARLARMEKEFTSTIVLTENETLLINESQYDKKRRCTKAPKRYEDFAETDDDYTRTSLSPKKKPSSAVVAIEATESLSSSTGFSEVTTELREPIFVKDTMLEQLKHCRVPLVPFEDTKNMAVWCMVHELYKCFCGGRAFEGKPLLVEKEEPSVTITHSNSAEGDYVMLPPKARYSFEKVEEEHEECTRVSDAEQEQNLSEVEEQPTVPNIANNKQQQQQQQKLEEENEELETESVGDATDSDSDFDANLHRPKKIRRVRSQLKRGRPTEVGIISDYFAMKPSFCRRAIPVPMKSYLRLNRKRRDDVREYIRTHENRQTMLQLNEHIMRSVYFHKNEAEKQRKAELIQQKTPVAVAEWKKKEVPARTIVDLTDEDSRQSSTASSTTSKHSRRRAAKRLRRLRMQQQWAERKKCEAAKPCEHTEEVDLTAQTAKSPPSVEVVDSKPEIEDAPVADAAKVPASPRLYKSFTLRGALPEEPAVSTPTSAASESHVSTPGVSAEPPPSAFNRDFNNVVIRYMNNLVSKKMQDIDQALKRESSVIPAPNNEILCIIKWTNFLDAFVEGFVFIWEVKMRDHSFFAATITNMMPQVLDAVGVVNIAALSSAQLPLMGRMLLERCRSEHTRNLAIVMQGRAKYWLVKGFLRPDAASVCQKPTPQTHPSLTRKINVLYNLLMKQRVKEFQRKLLQQQEQEGEQEKEQQQLREKRQRLQRKPEQAQSLLHELNERWPKFDQSQFETKKAAARATTSPQITSTSAQPANAQVLLQELHNVEQKCEQFLLENGLETKAAAAARANASPTMVAASAQLHSTQASHKTGTATTADSGTSTHHKKSTNSMQQQKCQPHNAPAAPSSASQKLSKKPLHGLNVDLLRDLSGQAGCTLMTTNIDFRKVTKEDIDEIHEPEVYTDDHRWLVLDLYSDFSHIFVPDFRDLVSLDRIHKVMAFSRQKQKIVKLQFFQDAPFNAFVTPSSMRKIYFGPLQLNTRPPLLILLQSVDGQMMLREIYQQQHNIQSNASERTTAFWILRINGHTHFEYDVQSGSGDDVVTLPDAVSCKEVDSDDDCMIVEDDQTQAQVALANTTAFYQPTAALSEDMNIPLPCVGSTTSFTIETNADTNQLQITPRLGGADELNTTPFVPIRLPLAAPLVQLPLTAQPSTGGLNLSANAVITGMAPAPQEAAYGTTIYISNVPPSDNALPIENVSSEEKGELQQLAQDSANVATTKTTFLTPDVCVTATTTGASVAKTAIAAGLTSTATPPSPTTPLSQQLTAIEASARDTSDSLIKIPAAPKSQRSTGIYVLPKPSFRQQGKKPLTPSSDLTRQRTSLSPQSNPATPTYITPDVQVTTAREATAGAEQAVPITRRRYSYFSTNTADGAKRITLSVEPRKSTGEMPAAVDEKPENASQRVSTIGCTTITKLADEVSKQKLRLRPDEQQPIVMPMQFLGDDDEPAASIVFKRLPEEAAKDDEMPTERVFIGQTLYKRTATGLLKVATTTKAATAATGSKSPATASAAISAAAISTVKLPTALRATKSSAAANTPKFLTLANVLSKNLTSIAPNAPKIDFHSAASTSTVTDKLTTATTTKLPTLSTFKTVTGSSSSSNATTRNSMLKVRTLPTEVATNEAAAAGNRYGLNTGARPKTITVRPVQQQRSSLPIITAVTSSATSVAAAATSSNAAAAPKTPIFNIKAAVPISQRRNSLPVKCNQKQLSGALAAAMRSSPQAARVINASPVKAQAKLVLTGATAATTSTATRVTPAVAATRTTNNKVATTAVPTNFSYARYGIFSCSVASAPKFLAKHVNGVYLIKVLGVGTVQLKGLQAVNNYLNSHMMKTSGLWHNKSRSCPEWVFVPQEQLRSPKINCKQGANTTQKFIISRRSPIRPKMSQSAASKTETEATTAASVSATGNSSKVLANAAAAMSTNVLNDPILIDD